MAQRVVPFMQFRGGSSKGLFFIATDLPHDQVERDRIILRAMEGVGAGDVRQIDGLGGGTSLTSKAAVVSRSTTPNTDLDYLFLQVVIGKGHVSASQNCGNMLAAVLPFAIESGLYPAANPVTTARINMVNTGSICEVTVQTPGGTVEYAGDTRIDGVPGTAAAIVCNYLGIEGSTCGTLLPTGRLIDEVNGVKLTCIDNGMPVVLIRASDVGVTGYESPEELEKNSQLKKKLEGIRLVAGTLMNLANVGNKTIPKMCLLSPAKNGGVINTRTFIPHMVHEAIGVLGAVSVASACLLPGSIAEGMSTISADSNLYSIEHPSGEFTVKLEHSKANGKISFNRCGVIRTARLISKGDVFIPGNN